MNTTLVFGGTGQLGMNLHHAWTTIKKPEDKLIALGSQSDISDKGLVYKIIDIHRPTHIINAAGGIWADEAESLPRQTHQLYSVGAYNVMMCAKKHSIPLMYVSSDFVFNGHKEGLYYEDSLVQPINRYGVEKMYGENHTLSYKEHSYVVRLASLFGSYGRRGQYGGFVDSCIHYALLGEDMRVRDDLLMSPTYALDAAETMLRLFDHDPGIYHCSNEGFTTWHGLAQFIYEFLGAKGTVHRRHKRIYSNARRPMNTAMGSRFDYTRWATWENAVHRYLRSKGLYRDNQEHNFAVIG